MIQGSLTEKIFGPELKLNMFERAAYSIAISVDDKIVSKIFKTNRNIHIIFYCTLISLLFFYI